MKLHFCKICNNYITDIQSIDDHTIKKNCNICKSSESFVNEPIKKNQEIPEYIINKNIIYDNTLERINLICSKCDHTTEHVIVKLHPKYLNVHVICINCSQTSGLNIQTDEVILPEIHHDNDEKIESGSSNQNSDDEDDTIDVE